MWSKFIFISSDRKNRWALLGGQAKRVRITRESDIWSDWAAVVQTAVRHPSMMPRFIRLSSYWISSGECVREEKHSVTIITALNSSSTERMVVLGGRSGGGFVTVKRHTPRSFIRVLNDEAFRLVFLMGNHLYRVIRRVAGKVRRKSKNNSEQEKKAFLWWRRPPWCYMSVSD